MENEAVYINLKDKTFSLEAVPVPVPSENELLIAVECTNVCTSDVHLWQWGKLGSVEMADAQILGHESAGRVVKLGPAVEGFEIGDKVAIECNSCCHKCEFCMTGNYNLCPKQIVGGYFARYVTQDANFCFKLPDNVSYQEGALIEPFTIGVHACRRAGISLGDFVLVCSAGAIGLSALLAAKLAGASKVIVTDIRNDRLNVAKRFGADYTLNVKSETEITAAHKIQHLLGEAPGVSIDCCGLQPALRTCIQATKPGGVIAVVGIEKDDVNIPMSDVVLKEMDIRGVKLYPNCYRRSISLLSSGAVDLKPLITHSFPLADLEKAFHLATQESSGAIRIAINCQE